MKTAAKVAPAAEVSKHVDYKGFFGCCAGYAVVADMNNQPWNFQIALQNSVKLAGQYSVCSDSCFSCRYSACRIGAMLPSATAARIAHSGSFA